MKVKDLISTKAITKINIFIIPILFIIFVVFGILIYRTKYSSIEQLNKLQTRITAQQITEKINDMLISYVAIGNSYNIMVAGYNKIGINDRRKQIASFTKSTLQTNKHLITGLCADLDISHFDNNNNLFKKSEIYPKDGHFCVYTTLTKEDSILFVYGTDEEEIQKVFPDNLGTKQIDFVGPYNWKDYNDTIKTTKLFTFRQPIIDSNDNHIGNTYLDVSNDDFYNAITNMFKKYNCDVFIFKHKSDTFIYHPDIEKIGHSCKEDFIYSDSLDYAFTQIAECSFDAYNHKYQENTLAFISPIIIPQSNTSLSVVVTFLYSSVAQSMNTVIIKFLIILFIVYLLIVVLILSTSRYVRKRFSHADVNFDNIKETNAEQ